MADSDNPSSATESVPVASSVLSELANLVRTGNFLATGSNVRQRRKARVDGLGHLAVVTEPKISQQLEYLQDIDSYLVWLDLISPHVLYTASSQFPQHFSQRPLDDFRDMCHPHPEEPYFFAKTDIGDLYETSCRRGILQDRETEGVDDCLSIFKDTSFCQFYGVVLRTQLNMYQILKGMVERAQENGTQILTIPHRYVEIFDKKSPPSKEDYFEHLVINCAEHKHRLLRLVRLILDLREAVGRAARHSYLDDASLKGLKSHLEPFHDAYGDATIALGGAVATGRRFIDVNSEQWWIADNSPKIGSLTPPTNVSDAYPLSPAMRSSLNFIVPTVMLFAVVPAALAWKYDSNRKGDWKDSQVYQTIAGNVIQLLGLVTFVWPTWNHPRLSRLNWLWIWLLAGFSAISAILSIALYVTVSSTWSFVVAFAGVLAQTIVQLQVINAI